MRLPKESAANTTLIYSTKPYLLLCLLFFLISFGLGYPTLRRYSPPTLPGLSDSAVYYQLVTGDPSSIARPYMRCRVLIPFVAKPFYRLARNYFSGFDAVAFGLLISNSIFTAIGACFLIAIAVRVAESAVVGLAATLLHLLNFAVPNLQLAGLVDAGEACFMLAVTWSLLTGSWWLLPVWGALGAFAKETFVPFALVFAIAWWLASRRDPKTEPGQPIALVLLAVASIGVMILIHSLIAGRLIWPWSIAAEARAPTGFVSALIRTVTDHGFWYVFVWLLPLGLVGLKRIPRPWLVASIATALVVFLFGAWKDMMGTVARPLFNTVGPMLSLSGAMVITEYLVKPIRKGAMR